MSRLGKFLRWKYAPAVLAIILFTILIIVISTVQQNRITNLKNEIQALHEDILLQEQHNKELEEQIEYAKTDEFYEEQARSQFGMLKQGEIRFKFEN